MRVPKNLLPVTILGGLLAFEAHGESGQCLLHYTREDGSKGAMKVENSPKKIQKLTDNLTAFGCGGFYVSDK